MGLIFSYFPTRNCVHHIWLSNKLNHVWYSTGNQEFYNMFKKKNWKPVNTNSTMYAHPIRVHANFNPHCCFLSLCEDSIAHLNILLTALLICSTLRTHLVRSFLVHCQTKVWKKKKHTHTQHQLTLTRIFESEAKLSSNYHRKCHKIL